jgi:hypothetical protein
VVSAARFLFLRVNYKAQAWSSMSEQKLEEFASTKRKAEARARLEIAGAVLRRQQGFAVFERR